MIGVERLQRRVNLSCHDVGRVVVTAEQIVLIVELFCRPEIVVPECRPSHIGEKVLLGRQNIDEKRLHFDDNRGSVEVGDLVPRLPQAIIKLCNSLERGVADTVLTAPQS